MFRVEAGARWTADDVTGRCCWVLLRCCDVSDLNRHTTSTVRVQFNSLAFFAERLARSFVITPANTCVQGWVPNFYTRVAKNTSSFSAKFPRLRKLCLASVSQQSFGKCLSRSKVAGDCLSHWRAVNWRHLQTLVCVSVKISQRFYSVALLHEGGWK